MITYLIHGIMEDGGDETTDKLVPHLEAQGLQVVCIDYNWHGLIRARMCNDSIARVISGVIHENQAIIGHSNGCLLIRRMADKYGIRFQYAGLINPALDRDKTIPEVRAADTWYSDDDRATGLARWVPFSSWGDQGRVGYRGASRLHQNHHMGAIGHSGVFHRPKQMDLIAEHISNQIKRLEK